MLNAAKSWLTSSQGEVMEIMHSVKLTILKAASLPWRAELIARIDLRRVCSISTKQILLF
jgi:hypothetical protein